MHQGMSNETEVTLSIQPLVKLATKTLRPEELPSYIQNPELNQCCLHQSTTNQPINQLDQCAQHRSRGGDEQPLCLSVLAAFDLVDVQFKTMSVEASSERNILKRNENIKMKEKPLCFLKQFLFPTSIFLRLGYKVIQETEATSCYIQLEVLILGSTDGCH